MLCLLKRYVYKIFVNASNNVTSLSTSNLANELIHYWIIEKILPANNAPVFENKDKTSLTQSV